MTLRALLLLAALLAGGCQSSVYKPGVPYHLSQISVTATGASTASPQVVSMVQQDLNRIAASRPAEGAPRTLDVMITEYHKKTALRSLLVGDANRITAQARIRAPESPAVEWEEEIRIVDTAAINGIIGAAVAANQDPGNVEARLSQKLASKVAGSAYGSTKLIPVPAGIPLPLRRQCSRKRQWPCRPNLRRPRPSQASDRFRLLGKPP
jgi:hypothetical protein